MASGQYDSYAVLCCMSMRIAFSFIALFYTTKPPEANMLERVISLGVTFTGGQWPFEQKHRLDHSGPGIRTGEKCYYCACPIRERGMLVFRTEQERKSVYSSVSCERY